VTPPPALLVMTERDDSWRHLAACRGMPTALFFPEPGRADPAAVTEAKSVCARCPVRERCLAAAMADEHGIWGGLTAAERRDARDRHGEAA